tara:strand:+ start:289 stop:720 length:432 start_codon:yes stop_codon:yes gene_type:complete
MQSLALNIIPFYFLFLIFLIYLSGKKSTTFIKKKETRIKDLSFFEDFVNDAEKKLIALKEMYDQNLITAKIYITKTQFIASQVKQNVEEVLIEESISLRELNIHSEIKNNLKKKIKKAKNETYKDNNLDSLILAVDKGIEKRQ